MSACRSYGSFNSVDDRKSKCNPVRHKHFA